MKTDPYNPLVFTGETEERMFAKATNKYSTVYEQEDAESVKHWIRNMVMKLSVIFEKPPVMVARSWHDFLTKQINDGKVNQVTITFLADERTLDLNKLASILKDGATAIFVSDQTELPTDDGKDKKDDKPADGQLSLLSGGKKEAQK